MTDAAMSPLSSSSSRWGITMGAVLLVHATLLYAIHQGMLQVPEAILPPMLISEVSLVESPPAPQPQQPLVKPQPAKRVERVEPRVQPKVKPVVSPTVLHTRSPQAVDTVTPVAPQPPAPVVDKPAATAAPVVAQSAVSDKGEAKAAPALELPSSDAAYLNNPNPPYPPMSQKLGEEGTVILRVFVQPDGRPGEVSIYKSSGFDRLDRSALETVKKHYRFVPGKRGGVPEGMWFNVPVKFQFK
jgi:periplasmic protein TonB